MKSVRLVAFLLLLLAVARPAVADVFLVGDEATGNIYRINYQSTGASTFTASVSTYLSLGTNASPFGMALGSGGDLYVPDMATGNILRYNTGTNPASPTATVVVTKGSGGLAGPFGLVFNNAGNLLVTSYGTDQVLEYSPTGTFIGVFAQGGGLDGPTGITRNTTTGQIYVSSSLTGRILRADAAGGTLISPFPMPTQVGQVAQITFTTNTPNGAAIYAAGFGNISNPGILTQLIQGSTVATGLPNTRPAGVSVDSSMNVLVADNTNGRILVRSRFVQAIGSFDLPAGSRPLYLLNVSESSIARITPVPEPSSLALLGVAGLTGLGYGLRRRAARRTA